MPAELTDDAPVLRAPDADAEMPPRRRLSAELLEFVSRAVGPDFAAQVARCIGEDEVRTETAFKLLFSAAVRRIARAAESREATERLFARLHGQKVAVDLSESLAVILGDGGRRAGAPHAAADQAAHALFGQKAGSLVLSVGSATGMAFDSVWRLACLVTPFAYAAVADYCSRRDLDAAGLRSLLATERNGARRSHRRRLDRALRKSGGRAIEAAFEGGVHALSRARAALGGLRSRIPELATARFVLPALAVAALSATAIIAVDTDHPQIPTANAAGLRAVASVTLPDGQRLELPRAGAVDRMVAFLSEDGVRGERVFMLDGMRFDDRSATLRSASRPQLEQVAAVLAAFPAARVDIAAPVDRGDDPNLERAFAEQRALAVRAALGALGVRQSRMSHGAAPVEGGLAGTGALQFSDGRIALRVTSD
jgi:outer membrane protein OmpA-like peptidoglycan-associated protein